MEFALSRNTLWHGARVNKQKTKRRVSRMKMLKCKSCGKEISKSAKSCPECGARRGASGCLIAFIVVFIIGLCALGGCLIIGGAATAGLAKAASDIAEKNAKEAKRLKSIKLLNAYVRITPNAQYQIFEFENVSKKNIVAFKGYFNIYNKFGERSDSIAIECTKTIPAGSKIYNGVLLAEQVDVNVWKKTLDDLKDIKRNTYPAYKVKAEKWKFECSKLIFEQGKVSNKK